MAQSFIVRPISREEARLMCADHPHAQTLPNSAKYQMRLEIGGRPAGLAVWGYGVMPKGTPNHLFGESGKVEDYLELCRFFVMDWCEKNTASKFLATTHRMIRKYAPQIKWLYTYAAGFQGMVGHIYKASGYDYIGRQECSALVYVPNVGLIHWVSLWHRYHLPVGSGRISPNVWPALLAIFPGAKRWAGYNFRYIYWLCSAQEKKRLMACAHFKIQPYPTETDLEIWLEDEKNCKTSISVEFAKSVPIVKLKSRRPKQAIASHPEDSGGAAPTRTLQDTQTGKHNAE